MSSILGALNVNSILLVYIPSMILTPVYTYYMAVSKGEEKPFPHSAVTSTACHYPQDIVFRFVMLICSSLLALSFLLEFRWARWQAVRVGFQPLSKLYQWVAWGSIVCYGVTIGTIDGEGVDTLHQVCAVTFFGLFMGEILRLTFYYRQLRKYDPSTISRCGLILKQILSFYILSVWAYFHDQIHLLYLLSSLKLSKKYSNQFFSVLFTIF